MAKPNTETVKVMVRVRPMNKEEQNNGKLAMQHNSLKDTKTA